DKENIMSSVFVSKDEGFRSLLDPAVVPVQNPT
ncbi:unnamed protein product, partial [marine sediment metagenome]